MNRFAFENDQSVCSSEKRPERRVEAGRLVRKQFQESRRDHGLGGGRKWTDVRDV